MLALRKTAAAPGLSLEEVPRAHPPAPGDVVVQVAAAGICGSDVHAYEWSGGYAFMASHLPLVMGHEFAGSLIRAGTGTGFREGDRIACIPFIPCGHCGPCRGGLPRECERRGTVGLTCDGGFAAEVRIPARCAIRLPDAVDMELGALAEPLGVGLEAVLLAEVKPGDRVLVLGPGTIGQALALAARQAGAAEVVVTGRDDAPRFAVLRALGFTRLVDRAVAPLAELVQGGFDVVLEATGMPATITEALPLLKGGGVCCVVGIHAGALSLPLTEFVRRRLQLRASHGAARPTWDRVLALLAANPERYRPMITHRLPLGLGLEGFELARQRSASKVILIP